MLFWIYVCVCVCVSGDALQHLSPLLRRNVEIVLAAAENDDRAMKHSKVSWEKIDAVEKRKIEREAAAAAFLNTLGKEDDGVDVSGGAQEKDLDEKYLGEMH
jgi:hypothetical protein